MQKTDMTFWEHLDVLRNSLIKIALAVVICGLVAFFFKDTMFDVIFAAKDTTFVTYRWFNEICRLMHLQTMDQFSIKLHCCPEKFYHSVSCLGPLPSGTLAVRSV
ncbi:twin-arginine translocase subunit TatC [Phocaeicola fibrisolvens]|uniref:twin-arginine translocase subunit TatC n=1 Tax=Phocaeicola fibrisolvens TaxID=2981793 RepID=UPI000821EFA2|nr:twin-arginine translocase subunit TatC [Phocaeicola fibrisolvens]SCI65064.1 Sec-independent protein translocase protein (TatC) [uncultured Bacteroides sp.]